MGLSSDLISQFVKATNDRTATKKESTHYGTVVEYNGSKYVRLDGSDLLTPVNSTVSIIDGDRAMVIIKDHTATVTGNLSDPAASNNVVNQIGAKVSEFEVVIADKVSTKILEAEIARIDALTADNVVIKDTLTATKADIDEVVANNITINGIVTAATAEIESLKTTKLDASIANITYASITDLNATNANIYNLQAAYGDFEVLATNKFTAIDGIIDDLKVNKLDVETAKITYANIDFSNISKVTMGQFYANSGLIENVVVGDGTITGNLVGVTIKGDLIEAGTVVADKLVIKGTDGLYYKLNTDGVKTEAEQTEYNSINGNVILAQSITATKINVSDLVAFDATIGGFKISENSIYSGVKETVDNNTSGVYLDSAGQVAFGDGHNYLKYFKDENNEYKLEISAQSILLGSSKKDIDTALTDTNKDIQELANDAQEKINDADKRMSQAESLIQQLSDAISMLVVDENGESLMTQTGDRWVFGMGQYASTLDSISNNLDDLTSSVGDTKNTVDILNRAMSDLGGLTEYVVITTYEGQPCLELGELDSSFKLRITNTATQFLDGSTVVAYVSNNKLYIDQAEVLSELQLGNFIWKKRSNGNLGLMWKGE